MTIPENDRPTAADRGPATGTPPGEGRPAPTHAPHPAGATTRSFAADPTLEADPEARRWAMITHLAALSGLLGNGIGFLLGPLVVWAFKKDQHPFVDEQGKEAMNFQLSMIIIALIGIVLAFTIIGLVIAVPLFIAVGIVAVVFPILAGIKANEGEHYRYPFAWRLIK